MRKYINAKTIVPALFIVIGIAWLCASVNMPSTSTVPGSGPSSFPNVILAIMSAASIVVLINEIVTIFKSKEEPTKTDWMELVRVLILVVLLVVYSLVINKAGFIICSLVLVEASLLLFGQRKLLWLILLPILSTGLIYVVFRFGLSILLPTIWLP